LRDLFLCTVTFFFEVGDAVDCGAAGFACPGAGTTLGEAFESAEDEAGFESPPCWDTDEHTNAQKITTRKNNLERCPTTSV
jgi:hypothetical protein